MAENDSDHSDLIGIDVNEAVTIKFERGRKRYDNGPWVGPDPLLCAHDEMLDFLAYIGKSAQNGLDHDLAYELLRQGFDLIQGVRIAISKTEKEDSSDERSG